jgi:hypothetical protein
MTEVVEQQEVNLTTNDFVMVVRLIDMVTQRGALTGDDLEPVGALRRRLINFLQANAPEVFKPAEEAPAKEVSE